MLKIVLPTKLVLGLLGAPFGRFPGGTVTLFALSWGVPALVVGIFMTRTRLCSRYTPSFAGICLVMGSVLAFVADSVYFGATLVPGGGMAFVVGPFAGLLAIPARVLIFVGIVKMFLCLNPDPVSCPEPLPELPPQQTSPVANPKQFRQPTREIK